MKRKRNGLPSNVAAARKGFSHANTITRALGDARPAGDAALTFWRDKLWQAADSVGVRLTDDQLEAMAADLVVAASNAPGSDE